MCSLSRSDVSGAQMAVSIVGLLPPLIICAFQALGYYGIVVELGMRCVVVHLDVLHIDRVTDAYRQNDLT